MAMAKIMARSRKPDETILRIEQYYKDNNVIMISALRCLPDTDELGDCLTIQLSSSIPGIMELDPSVDGVSLGLSVNTYGGETLAERFATLAYLMGDPKEMGNSMDFLLHYPEIMARKYSQWQLAGLRVFADHIDCSYTNGDCIEVVSLSIDPSDELDTELSVLKTNTNGKVDRSLQICHESCLHAAIGELRGYRIKRYSKSYPRYHDEIAESKATGRWTVPNTWYSLMIGQNPQRPGVNYLLEERFFAVDEIAERLPQEMSLTDDGSLLYDF